MPAFETIRTTTDRIEAELWLAALESEGVEARLDGVSDPALIGAAPELFPLALQVPAGEVTRAKELLESLREEPEERPEPPRLPQRRRRIAAGIAFLIPSGAHFYARRPWTAALLLAAWLATHVLMAARGYAASFGANLWAALIAADLIGGVRAVSAFNRGVVHGRLRQLAAGLAWVLGAALLAGAEPGLSAWADWREKEELRSVEVACTADRVRVLKRAGEPRRVKITVVRAVRSRSSFLILRGPEEYDAFGLKGLGASDATLAPGAALEQSLEWEGSGRRDCASGRGVAIGLFAAPAPGPCKIELSVTITRPDAPELTRVVRCGLDGQSEPLEPR